MHLEFFCIHVCCKRALNASTKFVLAFMWLLSDLSVPTTMLVSSTHALFAVIVSATVGFLSRPARPLPAACVCHCTSSSVEALEKDLTVGSPTYQPHLSIDTSVSWVFGGVLLGLILAFALASAWNCFVVSLRNSLDSSPEYQVRRPRALAP